MLLAHLLSRVLLPTFCVIVCILLFKALYWSADWQLAVIAALLLSYFLSFHCTRVLDSSCFDESQEKERKERRDRAAGVRARLMRVHQAPSRETAQSCCAAVRARISAQLEDALTPAETRDSPDVMTRTPAVPVTVRVRARREGTDAAAGYAGCDAGRPKDSLSECVCTEITFKLQGRGLQCRPA